MFKQQEHHSSVYEHIKNLTEENLEEVNTIENELDRYICHQIDEQEEDVFDFWIQNKDRFPNLYKIAEFYISIPVSLPEIRARNYQWLTFSLNSIKMKNDINILQTQC